VDNKGKKTAVNKDIHDPIRIAIVLRSREPNARGREETEEREEHGIPWYSQCCKSFSRSLRQVGSSSTASTRMPTGNWSLAPCPPFAFAACSFTSSTVISSGSANPTAPGSPEVPVWRQAGRQAHNKGVSLDPRNPRNGGERRIKPGRSKQGEESSTSTGAERERERERERRVCGTLVR